MTYKKLNESLKKELLKFVDRMEVDVEELDSYHWDSNPYCVEPQLAGGSGCGVWDENEEWKAKVSKAKDWIATDSAKYYLTLADEDYDEDGECETLTQECVNYLSTLED